MIDALAAQLAAAADAPGGITVLRGAAILNGPYPKKFDDFIGQDLAREEIILAIESAHKRDAWLDHMLLGSGLQGIGKTTLGRLTAALLGTGFVELGGTVTRDDALQAIRSMEDGDVMFIDEMHTLVQGNRTKADWLLTLMQDGKVQTGMGAVKAPAITIIGATTEVQKLPRTIIDRFRLKPKLVAYSTPEAVRIADTTARRLGFGTDVPMPEQTGWLRDIARAADNNPRRMSALLGSVRDIAIATGENLDPVKGYDITRSLEFSGLTYDGLTQTAQLYMLALYANDGAAGVATIKAIVQENNLEHTEAALLTKGYINVGARGRELTRTGVTRARELAKETVATHVAREEEVA